MSTSALTEAHTILPQVGTTPVFGILSTIFLQGRKNGLGTILSTQRSQKIHKDTITQSEIFVLHKVGHPRDIEVYEDLIPLPAKAVKAMIALLRKGSAIVKYEDDSLPEEVPNDVVVRVQIRPQETYHVGATPSFEEAAPISLRQIDETVLAELQRLLAATRPNETSLEAELRQRVASLEATNAQKDGTIGLLEEELGKRDEAIRELEKQVSLLSKLTVTITGLAFPELPAILPPSLTVDHARVGQVTIEDGPPLRESAALEEGARQVPPASDVQGILEAIAQHLAQVVQSDTELQRLQEKLSQHAQRLTATPSEGVKASLDEASLTSAQQRKLKGLITRLQRLSRFQRCLLHLLIQREGEEASYREISERLRYELGTVQHESTTALQREGLIKRARSTLGYISCFADYYQKKYPGADARLVCEQILSQVTVQ